MGDVINLNRYRKLRNRSDADRRAQENRAKFGKTRAERLRERQEAEKKERDMTGKKLELDDQEDETPDAG